MHLKQVIFPSLRMEKAPYNDKNYPIKFKVSGAPQFAKQRIVNSNEKNRHSFCQVKIY